MPVSAHITELDPVCEGVPVITQPVDLRAANRDEQFERIRRHERLGGVAEMGGELAAEKVGLALRASRLTPEDAPWNRNVWLPMLRSRLAPLSPGASTGITELVRRAMPYLVWNALHASFASSS